MRNITITKNAASCVLSVRPRGVDTVRPVDTHAQGQGTTVSFSAREARVPAFSVVLGALVSVPMTGIVPVSPAYKPTDVARLLNGRPPV